MHIDSVQLIDNRTLLINGINLYSNKTACNFVHATSNLTEVPNFSGCETCNGIESCTQATCKYPFTQASGDQVSFALTSYKGAYSTQQVKLSSLIAPVITKVEIRTILRDSLVGETILVSYDAHDLDHSMIWCSFNRTLPTLSIRLGPATVKCPIPPSIKQVGSYDLALSYDNSLWSQSFPGALNFIPNYRIRQLIIDSILPDLRKTREVGLLLTLQTRDTASLSCLIQVSNQTFVFNVTTSANRFVVKCLIPSSAMVGANTIGLGLLHLNEVVSYHQTGALFQQL